MRPHATGTGPCAKREDDDDEDAAIPGSRSRRGLSREVARAIHSVVGARSPTSTAAGASPTRAAPLAGGPGRLAQRRREQRRDRPLVLGDDIDEPQNVVRAVHRGREGRPSTGIHIHIDGSRFDAKSVTNR